ncbi:unnamed protein product, partial [Mesorhabditis spiculigera]
MPNSPNKIYDSLLVIRRVAVKKMEESTSELRKLVEDMRAKHLVTFKEVDRVELMGKYEADAKEWIEKSTKQKLIPSEFTSKTGLIIEVEIPGMEMYPTKHDFPKGLSSLRPFYSTIFRNFWSHESLSIKFYATKKEDIRKLLNILSSPPWETASLWGGGRFGFYNESDFPAEKDVYAWANAYPILAFYGFGKGINFTALVLKNLQKWLDGAEITHSFAQFHDGPWNFPFIGKKQEAFEKKYNVRIVMYENSSARLFCLF